MNVVLLSRVPSQSLVDSLPVEEDRLNDSSGADHHRCHVGHRESGGEVERGVVEVGFGVESSIIRQDSSVVVGVSKSIEGARGLDGEVGEGPNLREMREMTVSKRKEREESNEDSRSSSTSLERRSRVQ